MAWDDVCRMVLLPWVTTGNQNITNFSFFDRFDYAINAGGCLRQSKPRGTPFVRSSHYHHHLDQPVFQLANGGIFIGVHRADQRPRSLWMLMHGNHVCDKLLQVIIRSLNQHPFSSISGFCDAAASAIVELTQGHLEDAQQWILTQAMARWHGDGADYSPVLVTPSFHGYMIKQRALRECQIQQFA